MRSYDVMIAGGGPAGAAAAIAAARSGARTLLIEKDGFLGGAATGAGVPAFCPFTDGRTEIIRGIGLEILDALKRENPWRSPFFDHKPDRIEGVDWLPIDAEALKRVLDNLVTESGCDVLLHTSLADVRMEGSRIAQAILLGPSGPEAVGASVFVDGTGDGHLAARAGCEIDVGDEAGRVQAGTLCFQIANFDTERFMAYARESGENGNLILAAKRAIENGDFPAGEMKVAGIALPAPGVALLNFGHAYDLNPLDGASITRAEMQSRKRIPELMAFLRRYVPGAENAVLVSSGPNIGVRESRRVKGRYTLTMQDYLRRADFADAIAYYAYPIDCHAANMEDVAAAEKRYQSARYAPGEAYGVPYRCLTPAGVDNLLTAGRIVSCDRAMQASVRVMPCCFATGQAAGSAAAMAAKENIPVCDVNTDALRALLKAQGAYLK